MKKYFLSSICCVLVFFLHAQNNQWTWTAGENNYVGFNYGTKGVADSANFPSPRAGAATWVDASGDLWLFGGASAAFWKYSPANHMWSWVSGDTATNQPVYGTRGVAAVANTPGGGGSPGSWQVAGGTNLISWTDTAGKFWLYSNRLWKYDPLIGQWAWINGDTSNTNAAYGTKGVAAPTNKPGSGMVAEWTDGAGNFWFYGRVLWKYDVAADMWTWVWGDTTTTTTVYGQRGVPNSANTPGPRKEAMAWTDTAGKFWLFGGVGTVSNFQYLPRPTYTGPLNDLWKYDPLTNQWTWMQGDTLLYSGRNGPGCRSKAVSWKDMAGNFWLFGGYVDNSYISQIPYVRPIGDLWKYNPATNLWTYIGGSSSLVTRDTFGVKGAESPYTLPATRYGASGWTDRSGNLWMFGGITLDYNDLYSFSMNDLLKYNPNTNLWSLEQEHRGSIQWSTYGKKGVASPLNRPGGRYGAASCTDTAGNLWLFGGFGYKATGLYPDMLADLWKQDKAKQWTWAGTLAGNGVGREHAQMWMDTANRIWIYGGVYAGSNTGNLWRVDPVTYQATQVSSPGSYYGTKGQPAATNGPGLRNNAVTWTDKAGKLWMFGGNTSSFTGPYNLQKNDIWNYNPATGWWTWINGDSTAGQPAVFGTRGITSAANKPGGRMGAASWTDTSGNIWIFGGYRDDSTYLSDLWKYNPLTNQWTWMHGDSTTNRSSVYGTKDVANAANKPGGRCDAVRWIDLSGKMWLFGGAVKGRSSRISFQTGFNLNDLWRYDPETNAWTWISGDTTVDQYGWYGKPGVADAGNKPGTRSGAVGYTDTAGNLRMIGGVGYGWKGSSLLNDEWTFSPFSATALPVHFIDFSATAQDKEALLQWHASGEQDGAYYIIERSREGIRYDSIGTVRAVSGNPSAINTHLFTDHTPFTETNYYRIKQTDPDGRFTYSKIVKLWFEQAGWRYMLVPNPVQDELKVKFQSGRAVMTQVSVRDAAGHLLISRQQPVSNGSSVYLIPVKSLATGTYFLSVTVGKTTSTKKFVKR